MSVFSADTPEECTTKSTDRDCNKFAIGSHNNTIILLEYNINTITLSIIL